LLLHYFLSIVSFFNVLVCPGAFPESECKVTPSF